MEQYRSWLFPSGLGTLNSHRPKHEDLCAVSFGYQFTQILHVKVKKLLLLICSFVKMHSLTLGTLQSILPKKKKIVLYSMTQQTADPVLCAFPSTLHIKKNNWCIFQSSLPKWYQRAGSIFEPRRGKQILKPNIFPLGCSKQCPIRPRPITVSDIIAQEL